MDDQRTRATSFGEIADRYDIFRSRPPTAAVDWLLPDGCKTVVDLAAGTGALTASLIDRVPQVIAVEPDPRMREILLRNCPAAQVLAGSGEQIPLPDAAADALLIATAWHWLDPQRAVPEIARVLRRGGTFGILWTHRDLCVPWVAELDDFTRALRGSDADQARAGHAVDPPTGKLFSPLSENRITWSEPVTAAEIVGLMGTDASAIALPADVRRAVDERVAAYARNELGLSGVQTIDLPISARCLRCTRTSVPVG